ncbi:hypothetical protein [Nonomuraea candida]|uniref:hypothetical protein n=1 Tax=Nonomuraea candida TaxID=359159 RepID=UPI0012F7B08F|nr:hypothetical protein [Nonomuraea candida]
MTSPPPPSSDGPRPASGSPPPPPDDPPPASGAPPSASGTRPVLRVGWRPPPRAPSAPRPRPADQVLAVTGFACAAVAVLFSPVVFGLAGVVLGVVGHLRGEPLGRWAATAAGAGMLLGTLLSILLTAA